MIDALFQAGTDAALDDLVRRARPQKEDPPPGAGALGFGIGRGLFRSGGAAVAEGIVFGAEALDFTLRPPSQRVTPSNPSTVEHLRRAAETKQKLRADLAEFMDAGRLRSAELMPDPQTAHVSEQYAAGFGRFIGKAAQHVVAAGPLAPLTFALDEGLTEAAKLKGQGVDLPTRTKAAVVAGAGAGLTIALPVMGTGLAQTAGLVALGGPGVTIAQNAGMQAILKNAGYDKIADQYDPFDPVTLGLSVALPGAIGFGAHAVRAARAKPTLADVMLDNESRGQRYGKDGRLLTSPKGAQGEMQVMPATNRDPGFGVAPARDGSPDELARVGRDYLAAMQARYGDDSKAMAAYNAGPGRVDAAIKAGGADWLAKLPEETRNYVARGQRLLGEEQVAQAVRANPELVDAARVQLAANSIDAARLTPDADLPGRNAHIAAVERASDQLGAGEPVDVGALMSDRVVDAARSRRFDFESEIVNPIDRFASPREKVDQLNALTEQNKPVVAAVMRQIDEALGTTTSKDNVKLPEKILSKASRPEIIARKPWHDVEHIRDSYRFKTPLDNFDDLAKIAAVHRAAGLEHVKIDTAKVLKPGPWGWRIASFDLRMPNGQIVEHYMPVKELEAAKKKGHVLFDRWRNLDERVLTVQQRIARTRDQSESNTLYQAAWDSFLSRSNSTEQTVRASLERFDASGSGTGMKKSSSSTEPTALPYSQTPAADLSAPNPSKPLTSTLPVDSSLNTRSASIDPSIPVVATGKDATALTERGTEIPVRWALVEASDLVTSHDNALAKNPAYPQELQPRDRGRAASEQQIASIENNIRPELLGDSPKASDGAPIIGQDGVVESGNARTIALRRAYEGGKADKYRAWLEGATEKAGIDPKALEGMTAPVLVRVGQGDYNRAEFARQANESPVASMSQTEQAKSDAGRLPDLETLATGDDGTISVGQSGPFIRAFMQQVVAPAERGSMMTASGELSQQGMKRIRDAVFAKAYGDADLVAMMAESTDANVKNILAGMLRAAPRVARLADLMEAGARPKADITGPLVEAVRKFSQLRADGMTVDNFLAQRGMFDDGLKPETTDMLKSLQADSRAPKRVAETITRMVDDVDALGDPRQAGMFDAPDAGQVVKQSAEQASMKARIDELLARAPDMQVRLPDGEATTLRQALVEIDATFRAETGDAALVQVAADCFLQAA